MPSPSQVITKAKHKNLDVKIFHSKYLSGVTVVISIPCASGIDSSILSALKSKTCDEDRGVLYKNTELTVLFHVMHLNIASKLKLPAAVKSTGLIDVQCHYYNKQFNMVFRIGKPTGTAAKKVLSEALRYSKPASLYIPYSAMLKSMGLLSNRKEFNWCATQINKCLRDTICVFIVGKINLSTDNSKRIQKTKDITESAFGKLAPPSPKGSSHSPESLGNSSYVMASTTLSVSGLNGFYLAEYVCYKTKGSVRVSLQNNQLVFPSAGYETLIKKLKDKKSLNTYVKTKYGKIYKADKNKDSLTAIVLKNSSDICMADAKSLFSVADKTLKPADVATGIVSALK